MSGLIGKKIGMTSLFDDNGNNIPCTVIQAGPCIVTQVKTKDTDGYDAIQLAYDDVSEKKVSKPLMGHFNKVKTTPKRKVAEFTRFEVPKKFGDELDVNVFIEGEFVDVVGKSKGKGFAGVMRRHGFGGVNDATHGQKDRLRAPGSIGASSDPSRVFKGMRMGGRTGQDRVKMINLQVLKIDKENNLLVVKGAVPGAIGSYVIVERWS